jgi:tetratricopeptide (TPR) repeat protein
MLRYQIRLHLVLAAVCAANVAHAYNFYPTQAEWAVWPEFCKARYVTVPVGAASEYKDLVSPDLIATWTGILGSCWSGVHHYCAGIAKWSRAKSGQKSDYALVDALSEFDYVRKWCPRENQFWSQNESYRAMTLAAKGQRGPAMVSIGEAISSHPSYDGSYIAKSMLLRDEGKLLEAHQALLDGEKATEGRSAELQYALGLSYFQRKEFEKARDAARKAYQLGYPLPGLRDRLKKSGYPL